MIHREDLERSGVRIATLRIEHGKANAIDVDFFDALTEELDAIEPSDADAVVLTGSGGSFSAGVQLYAVVEGGSDYLKDFLPALSHGLRRLFTYSKPVVAAVNGHAIAGGCILALACDRRIATSGPMKMGVTELLVGVPFPVAPMEVLRYHFPHSVVQDLVYSGRLVGGEEALSLGMVDELAAPDELLERACDAAARLGRIPHDAFTVTKRQIRRDAIEALDRGEALDEEIARIWADPATLAGIRAFMERTVSKG